MKKLVLAFVLIALLALSGCVMDTEPAPTALPPMAQPQMETREQLYELYNQVNFNDTMEDLEAKLGPAVREEIAMDTSTGINLSWERNGVYTIVAFSDSQIVGKAVSFDDPRVIAKLCEGIEFEKVHKIEVGMNYAQVVELMGCEGVEMLARVNRDASPVTVDRLMRWADDTGSTVQMLFGQDGTMSSAENSSALYKFPTLEPGATYAPTPTVDPEATPRSTAIVTMAPTAEPTEVPTEEPTAEPTEIPTEEPTAQPTEIPTEEPTAKPTEIPTEEPAATAAAAA